MASRHFVEVFVVLIVFGIPLLLLVAGLVLRRVSTPPLTGEYPRERDTVQQRTRPGSTAVEQ